MPTEYPKRSTDPIRPSLKVVESPKSGSVMIARIVGILCVSGGFVLGIQGLDNPDSLMLICELLVSHSDRRSLFSHGELCALAR
jgi:hypothetical protein